MPIGAHVTQESKSTCSLCPNCLCGYTLSPLSPLSPLNTTTPNPPSMSGWDPLPLPLINEPDQDPITSLLKENPAQNPSHSIIPGSDQAEGANLSATEDSATRRREKNRQSSRKYRQARNKKMSELQKTWSSLCGQLDKLCETLECGPESANYPIIKVKTAPPSKNYSSTPDKKKRNADSSRRIRDRNKAQHEQILNTIDKLKKRISQLEETLAKKNSPDQMNSESLSQHGVFKRRKRNPSSTSAQELQMQPAAP